MAILIICKVYTTKSIAWNKLIDQTKTKEPLKFQPNDEYFFRWWLFNWSLYHHHHHKSSST